MQPRRLAILPHNLTKVHAQVLKHNAQVIAMHKMAAQLNTVVTPILVGRVNELEDLKLLASSLEPGVRGRGRGRRADTS